VIGGASTPQIHPLKADIRINFRFLWGSFCHHKRMRDLLIVHFNEELVSLSKRMANFPILFIQLNSLLIDEKELIGM
jgi:hypothetical protein